MQDQRSGARERGYTGAWDRAAARFKAQNPLCVGCQAVGRVEVAAVVDHIRPHRGNRALFWDAGNWQSSCDWHHNTVKKTLEALWDRGAIGPDDLRLDSAKAIELTRSTPRRPQVIGLDGWPA